MKISGDFGAVRYFKSHIYFCLFTSGVWLLQEKVYNVKICIENLSVCVTKFKEGQVANANRDCLVPDRAGVRWVSRLVGQGWGWCQGTVAWAGVKTG